MVGNAHQLVQRFVSSWVLSHRRQNNEDDRREGHGIGPPVVSTSPPGLAATRCHYKPLYSQAGGDTPSIARAATGDMIHAANSTPLLWWYRSRRCISLKVVAGFAAMKEDDLGELMPHRAFDKDRDGFVRRSLCLLVTGRTGTQESRKCHIYIANGGWWRANATLKTSPASERHPVQRVFFSGHSLPVSLEDQSNRQD